MALRASILNQGDVAIIALEGKLDYENQEVLTDNILTLMAEGKQIVVDMDQLNFVGSSGITHFIRSLYEMKEAGRTPPRLCNVRSEFRQIINAYDVNKEFSIHTSREDAVTSFFRAGSGENN
jgi:anti-anti-sigma factor